MAPRRVGLPPAAPIPAALQTLAFWRDPHSYLDWNRRRYGPRFVIRPVGMAPMVFFSELSDIRAIVSASPDVLWPGEGASVIAPLVGERSFMLSEGEEHMRGRRAVLPAFRGAAVAAHRETVLRIVSEELDRWPVGQPVRLHPWLRALTLRVILSTIFGFEDRRVRELHGLLLGMLDVTGSLALQEAQLRRVAPWRGLWRDFIAARRAVEPLLNDLIGEAQRTGRAGRLLSDLARERGARGSAQVQSDLMSVILAGHETTASQIAWALQLLAHGETARERVVGALDGGDETWLRACVQEAMRHRPVFLFTIPRVVKEPFELGGVVYRPPLQLIGCIHLLHHDPSLFERPGAFDPGRFLDEGSTAWFMPWGGGRKRCPGHRLATLEMQLVLGEILRRWTPRPVSRRLETARWRSVIVTPGGGCRLILEPRRAPRSARAADLSGSSRAGRLLGDVVSLAGAVQRELTTGLRAASGEAKHWRARAAAIPDAAVRAAAVDAIDGKLPNIHGAALFWTLPRHRSRELLALLVAFEALADFLDCVDERSASSSGVHDALVDAVEPFKPLRDYVAGDGGYTAGLVRRCQSSALRLPGFAAIHPAVAELAALTRVQALNHISDPDLRASALHRWASTHAAAGVAELEWFELAGAGSAWLATLALLACAADRKVESSQMRAVGNAYMPWVCLAGTMLDSFGDLARDEEQDAHSYVSYYASSAAAARRIEQIAARAMSAVSALPHGSRHRVIVASMIAMYLSKDSLWYGQREQVRRIASAAGPMTRMLVPALRCWRSGFGQRAA